MNGNQDPKATEDTDQSKMKEINELKEELQAAKIIAEERLDLLMRCRADLDNFMKRSVKEKEETEKYASEKLIIKLLPVLDSLDQASKHDEGMKVLSMQLLGILSAEGLVPMESLGKKFDPFKHEALCQIQKEDIEEDTIVEEVQKGYLIGSHIIRFSKVVVAKRR